MPARNAQCPRKMLVRMTRRNAILKMVNPIQVWGEMVLLTSRDEGMDRAVQKD